MSLTRVLPLLFLLSFFVGSYADYRLNFYSHGDSFNKVGIKNITVVMSCKAPSYKAKWGQTATHHKTKTSADINTNTAYPVIVEFGKRACRNEGWHRTHFQVIIKTHDGISYKCDEPVDQKSNQHKNDKDYWILNVGHPELCRIITYA